MKKFSILIINIIKKRLNAHWLKKKLFFILKNLNCFFTKILIQFLNSILFLREIINAWFHNLIFIKKLRDCYNNYPSFFGFCLSHIVIFIFTFYLYKNLMDHFSYEKPYFGIFQPLDFSKYNMYEIGQEDQRIAWWCFYMLNGESPFVKFLQILCYFISFIFFYFYEIINEEIENFDKKKSHLFYYELLLLIKKISLSFFLISIIYFQIVFNIILVGV